MEKKHYFEIEILRVIAALAVILIHVTSISYNNNTISYYLNIASCFAVPSFIFLSGLSLHLSAKNKPIKYFKYLRGRIFRIGLPYLIWSWIYIFGRYNFDLSLLTKTAIYSEYIKGLVYGNNSEHLYFIVIIVQFYILYPVLKKIFKIAPKLFTFLSIILSISVTIERLLYQIDINILPDIVRQNVIILFPRWLIYFVLGMLIAEHIDVVLEVLNRAFAEISGLFILVFLMLIISARSMTFNSIETYPMIMLYSLMSIIILLSLSTYTLSLPLIFRQGVSWFSKQSFFIYLVHPLILRRIVVKLALLLEIPIWNKAIGVIFLYVLTLLISFAVTYVIAMTPFYKIFGLVRTGKGISFKSITDKNIIVQNLKPRRYKLLITFLVVVCVFMILRRVSVGGSDSNTESTLNVDSNRQSNMEVNTDSEASNMNQKMHLVYDEKARLFIEMLIGDNPLNLTFDYGGVNNQYGIQDIDYIEEVNVYSMETTTDWIGPYIVKDVEGEEGAEEYYTGGWHEVPDEDELIRTLETVSVEITCDGKLISPNTSYDVDVCTIKVKSLVCAYIILTT